MLALLKNVKRGVSKAARQLGACMQQGGVFLPIGNRAAQRRLSCVNGLRQVALERQACKSELTTIDCRLQSETIGEKKEQEEKMALAPSIPTKPRQDTLQALKASDDTIINNTDLITLISTRKNDYQYLADLYRSSRSLPRLPIHIYNILLKALYRTGNTQLTDSLLAHIHSLAEKTPALNFSLETFEIIFEHVCLHPAKIRVFEHYLDLMRHRYKIHPSFNTRLFAILAYAKSGLVGEALPQINGLFDDIVDKDDVSNGVLSGGRLVWFVKNMCMYGGVQCIEKFCAGARDCGLALPAEAYHRLLLCGIRKGSVSLVKYAWDNYAAIGIDSGLCAELLVFARNKGMEMCEEKVLACFMNAHSASFGCGKATFQSVLGAEWPFPPSGDALHAEALFYAAPSLYPLVRHTIDAFDDVLPADGFFDVQKLGGECIDYALYFCNLKRKNGLNDEFTGAASLSDIDYTNTKTLLHENIGKETDTAFLQYNENAKKCIPSFIPLLLLKINSIASAYENSKNYPDAIDTKILSSMLQTLSEYTNLIPASISINLLLLCIKNELRPAFFHQVVHKVTSKFFLTYLKNSIVNINTNCCYSEELKSAIEVRENELKCMLNDTAVFFGRQNRRKVCRF